jgi:hypothetical protein
MIAVTKISSKGRTTISHDVLAEVANQGALLTTDAQHGMTPAKSNQENDWPGDLLDRKPSGEFLYRLVLKKAATVPGGGALCFAIDGDWGTGKSFFVNSWSHDISLWNHPVIRFDAWANDLSEDPLLGFMAQLQNSLQPWLKQLPVSKKIKQAAARQLNKVVKDAGRAVLPVTVAVLKGVTKKFAGIDISEVAEAATGAVDAGVKGFDVGSTAGAALDAYFQAAMKSHTEKQEAIQVLKKTIEDLLTYLKDNTAIQLPLFVFVDELDRCRPDYAIRLLEGLKHLFDAKGVCFVVSTNLSQLSESVRAVYGAGFAGYRYLKRFFAFEYVLPSPNLKSYAKALAAQSFLGDGTFKVISGLLSEGLASDSIATSFAWIAEAFTLDLRSQQQVFKHAEAAAAGLPAGSQLHCFYLFFLAAVLHYDRQTFEDVFSEQNSSSQDARAIFSKIGFADASVPFTYMEPGQGRKTIGIQASDAYFTYRGIAGTPVLKTWE